MRAERVAADTSVLVPAYLSGHELHEAARIALDRPVSVPVHVIVETYATLTAMPAPYRQEPSMVLAWLAEEFPNTLPHPSSDLVRTMLAAAGGAGVRGGAVYDALIATNVLGSGLRLVSADERALPTYRRVGVEVDVVRAGPGR